jgi:hypothetical protein
MFKCTDSSGHIAYQDRPCTDTQQKEMPKMPSPSTSKNSDYDIEKDFASCPKTSPGEAVALFYGPYITVIGKHSCDAQVPGFKDRTDSDYAKWKTVDPSVAQIEGEREVKSQIAASQAQGGKKIAPDEFAAIARQCDRVADMIRLSAIPPAARPQHMPDARFSNPNKTLEWLRTTLRQGQGEQAMRAIVGEAKASLAKLLPTLSASELSSLADVLQPYRFGGWMGTRCVQAYAARPTSKGAGWEDGRFRRVDFVNAGGEWRIQKFEIEEFEALANRR